MAYPVLDLHCDTASMLCLHDAPADVVARIGIPEAFIPGSDADLVDNALHVSTEQIGRTPWAQCFACFLPDAMAPEDGGPFWKSVSAFLDRQVAEHPDRLVSVRSSRDLRAAVESGRVGVVKTLENATLFAHDVELVHQCAEDGLLMASLSWNGAGPLASGISDEASGLTERGREVVRRLEQERVIVDVSHLNDVCFDEVARLTESPFVASHSNSRAVCRHPRNLTDDQFKVICERGGLVGLNYERNFLADDPASMGDGASTIFAHIEHWLDLGGEKVVALGSDFDGCAPAPCIANAAMMAEFQGRLATEFGEGVTEALCGGNAIRFFETWGR